MQPSPSPAPAPIPAPISAPPRRKRRVLANILLMVLLVIAGLVAWLAPAVPTLRTYGALPQVPGATRSFLVAGIAPNYLGHHTPDPDEFAGLADTILLVQLRANEPVVRILNVPRDSLVTLPGYGTTRINAAIRAAGPDGLVRAVRDLTGVPLEGYVLLSVSALRDVTDAAGGVTVDIRQAMKYQDTAAKLDIDFSPGRQHLSGAEAEAYLRFRHDNLGDIGRVARQQEFLKTLERRLVSPTGWPQLPAVVAALGENTRTNLAREDVAAVLGAMLRRPAVEPHLLPGDFGGVYWVPDREGIAALVAEKFALERAAGDPRALKIAVVNVNAPDGSARRLKEKLEALGYANVTTSNGDGDPERTTVLASDKKAAERVRADLGYGRVVLGGVGEAGADLTIRLGADSPAN